MNDDLVCKECGRKVLDELYMKIEDSWICQQCIAKIINPDILRVEHLPDFAL